MKRERAAGSELVAGGTEDSETAPTFHGRSHRPDVEFLPVCLWSIFEINH